VENTLRKEFKKLPLIQRRLIYFMGFGIPLIIFSIIYLTNSIVNGDQPSYCEKIYKKEIKAVVNKKYIDKNHAVECLEILNFNKEEIVLHAAAFKEWEDFWDTIQIGDTIKKDSNSTRYNIGSFRKFNLSCK
jgi:hypothetical protein